MKIEHENLSKVNEFMNLIEPLADTIREEKYNLIDSVSKLLHAYTVRLIDLCGEGIIKGESDPKPDVNGWWGIEERKPIVGQHIKFKDSRNNETYIGMVNLNERIETINGYIYFTAISKWCPLDMTGPEEER